MVFGKRIKELRIEKQWTQEYVCSKLNISSGALSRYETSMYEPKSLELVKDFANLFDVSTDYLLGKTDIRNYDKDEEEFRFAYHKETEGLSEEEIADALRFYKEMKKKISKDK